MVHKDLEIMAAEISHRLTVAGCRPCSACGVCHPHGTPHNLLSAQYRELFVKEFNREPNWEDALAVATYQEGRKWRSWLKTRFPDFPEVSGQIRIHAHRGKSANPVAADTFCKAIGVKIRERRLEMGYHSVAQAIREVNKVYPGLIDSHDQWAQAERGINEMRFTTYLRLCIALKCDLSDLLPENSGFAFGDCEAPRQADLDRNIINELNMGMKHEQQ